MTPPARETRRRRSLELLVAGCFFLEIFDATVVTTAAPRLAADLRVSLPSVGLLVTAYLTTAACLMPASSWLGARHGPRRVLCAAIGIFLLGSIGCAAAASFPELVAMRVVQGAGGALMVPVGRLVVLAGRPRADVMRTVGFLVWPGLLARCSHRRSPGGRRRGRMAAALPARRYPRRWRRCSSHVASCREPRAATAGGSTGSVSAWAAVPSAA